MEKLKSTMNPGGVKKVKQYIQDQKQFREKLSKLFYYSKLEEMRTFLNYSRDQFEAMMKTFGPLRLPDKRTASIKVCENSTMLEITADTFANYIAPQIQDDLMEKMRFLSCQLFFAVVQSYQDQP
jgi:hypothetical protein